MNGAGPSSTGEPVRVRLRYAAFETFIDKFAPNVTRGGIFLASRTPRAVGDEFAFEVLLSGGEVALTGEGRVTWVKPYDPTTPNRAHGMGVQFMRLDAHSRDIVNRMLARKAAAASGSMPGRPMAGMSGASGTFADGLPAARIDTNVDLAAELGVDEGQVKRALERYRMSAGRGAAEIDDLEALLRPEPAAPASLPQALLELPRMLDPAARRRTGALRPLAELFPSLAAPPPSDDVEKPK
jgi:molecular chaperone DnaK